MALKRIIDHLRSSLGVRRAARVEPLFEPDYRDARFFEILCASSSMERPAALRAACTAWQRGDAAAAASGVITHYATRQMPRFFADVPKLLSRGDPAVACWIEAAAAQVRQMTDVGLRVYGRVAPPMRAGFPWADPAGGGREDLLYAVHVHRFQFLPRLAMAAATGGYDPHLLLAVLNDWTAFAQSEPKVSFCSNLVVIQRLLATSWAFAFAAAVPTPQRDELRLCLLRLIAQDIAYLCPRLGHSYPNNHLLVDRFAAWYIALLFPELLPIAPDVDALDAAWCAELVRQTYEDGGGFEHSTHYHGLASEMAAAYLLLARENRRSVQPEVRARIGRMLELQAALAGVDGNAPEIGDSSDDPLFPLDGGAPGNEAALRELHRALFAPNTLPLVAGHPARERAYWLLGGELAAPPARAAARSMVEFPHGGFVVFADDDETTRCVFRTGPTKKSRYVAGHMHDDSLSITLTRRGTPLIVEAGTFTYRYQAPGRESTGTAWRTYFAGPDAHNGLVMADRHPFGALRGDFRPPGTLPEVQHTARASGDLLAFAEAERSSIADHPRWIRGVISLRGFGFIVYDLVEPPTVASPVRFAFQFAPSCSVGAVAPNAIVARSGGASARLAWSAGLGAAEVVSGREDPPNGWVSPGYGERVAAPQVIVPLAHGCSFSSFVVDSDVAGAPPSVQCERPSPDTRAIRVERESGTDLVLVNAGAAQDKMQAFGCSFEGRIAWITVANSGRAIVRWLDGISCESDTLGIRHRVSTLTREYER